MNLIIENNDNVNYLAKIVNITEFYPHTNPEVNKMKRCFVDGYNIIVGTDTPIGIYIYFPNGCVINPDFLSFCNLYRDKTKNQDKTKSGFFDNSGRVKSIRLRGTGKDENGNRFYYPYSVSDGFIIEFHYFNSFLKSKFNTHISDVQIDSEFDSVKINEKSNYWIVKKYTAPIAEPQLSSGGKRRKTKGIDKVIPEQFKYHYQTLKVQKDPYCIQPRDLISITSKMHGTSGVFSYVLCNKKPTWKERIASWITGKPVIDYDYLYSSHRVIKNQYYDKETSLGFYDCDVWKDAFEILKPKLIKGMSIYAEIVGFTRNGNYIQKDYDYGCTVPMDRYIYKRNFKIYVYRITLTNPDGISHEFSAREVQEYCLRHDMVPVPQLYYGYASDLYPHIDVKEKWHENFWNELSQDKNFYMELKSPDCFNNVPHEGLVIKKENTIPEAWKLKCFAFTDRENKDNTPNIEDIN